MSIIRDVVSFVSRTGVTLAILSLDQEKAFDCVDWGFMRATLGRMGFKYSFLRWVSLFYTQVQSAVIVNGHISPFFSLSRGVRQGCPLSPLLYVLVAETLAVNIRCNPRIPGLCLPGVPLVVSPVHQYADDTMLTLSADDSIKAVFDIYSLFEKASGSRLNQSKSKGLWLGSWVGRLFLTVLKNLGLVLVHFICRPLGVNFILLILTVQFWTSLGRSLMVLF